MEIATPTGAVYITTYNLFVLYFYNSCFKTAPISSGCTDEICRSNYFKSIFRICIMFQSKYSIHHLF